MSLPLTMSWRMFAFTSKIATRLAIAKPVLNQGFNHSLISNLARNQLVSSEGRKCYSTFFTQSNAEDLKKGMFGVSNAGRKKGRGRKSGKSFPNLHTLHNIGSGYENMAWPGLTTSSVNKGVRVQAVKLPKDPEKDEKMKIRNQIKPKYPKLTPLERGYTGSKLPGQKVGPPDPVSDYTFDGFESIVLEYKSVSSMTGTIGRRMKYSCFVVTGNRNGIAGYGLGKAKNPKSAVRLAKNLAGKHLMYIPRFEDHTVYHNMFTKFWRSNILIHKKEEGFGLRCHRVLKSICEMAGIKNLHCKVEASTGNVQNVTKAFFNALIHQETHAELADRIGYHVVELKNGDDYRPKLIASPKEVKKEKLVDEVEDIEVNFERLYYGGRCELPRYPKRWAYMNHQPYIIRTRTLHGYRNQFQADVLRRAGLV